MNLSLAFNGSISNERIVSLSSDARSIIFPEGSYWVYEDSITGTIDSIYLTSRRIEIGSDRTFGNVKFEKLTQVFNSTNGRRVSNTFLEFTQSHDVLVFCQSLFEPYFYYDRNSPLKQ